MKTSSRARAMVLAGVLSIILPLSVLAQSPPPSGAPPSWSAMVERAVGGPEADLVVRTGDISNLGFDWPARLDPFSGKSTPAHGYPWTPPKGAAPGTDRKKARATSVVEWLTSKGVAASRLVPQGFGPTRPVADNARKMDGL